MDATDRIFLAMIDYFANDPKRIQHLTKVHAFARIIGREEQLDARTQFVLESAALVHDIGIRPAETKFGSCSGALQEQEGPAEARRLLENLDIAPDVVNRVCFLVGHHHTYTDIHDPDYQILVEADFLVNLYEDNESKHAASAALRRIFRTPSGSRICKTMFGLEEE